MKKVIFITLGLLMISLVSFSQANQPPKKQQKHEEKTLGLELSTKGNQENVYEFSQSSVNISLDLGNVDTEISEILEDKSCEKCIDTMMETWFQDFVLLQENGKSARDANQLATTSAILLYRLCSLSESSLLN